MSVQSEVTACMSEMLAAVQQQNGHDTPLDKYLCARTVRDSIEQAYCASRQQPDVQATDAVCTDAALGYLTWQGVQRVLKDGHDAKTFCDAMPGYWGGEGSDGSVILPWCDGRYRCLVCPNGIGPGGMGFSNVAHVPCKQRAMHMGTFGCNIGVQVGRPCGAGAIPGIESSNSACGGLQYWRDDYDCGIFAVGFDRVGLHPAMLTVPELARKLQPDDLPHAAHLLLKCVPVARMAVHHPMDSVLLSTWRTIEPLKPGLWCNDCRDAHCRGVGAPLADAAAGCPTAVHSGWFGGRHLYVTHCNGSGDSCPEERRAAFTVRGRISNAGGKRGRKDAILPLCTGLYACLVCGTKPVTRPKNAKQMCTNWQCHMPTAAQHGKDACVHAAIVTMGTNTCSKCVAK